MRGRVYAFGGTEAACVGRRGFLLLQRGVSDPSTYGAQVLMSVDEAAWGDYRTAEFPAMCAAACAEEPHCVFFSYNGGTWRPAHTPAAPAPPLSIRRPVRSRPAPPSSAVASR